MIPDTAEGSDDDSGRKKKNQECYINTHTALHLSNSNSNISQFDDTDFKKYLSVKYICKKVVLEFIQQI